VSEHPPAHTPLPAFRREVPHSLRRARGHDGRRPPPKAPAHASCGRSRRTHRQEMRSDHASDASCRMVACDVRVHDVRTHDVHTRDVRTRFRPVSPPQSNATVTTPSSLSLSLCVCVCVSSHLVSSRVALSLARSLAHSSESARRRDGAPIPKRPTPPRRGGVHHRLRSSPPIIASDHRLRSSPPIISLRQRRCSAPPSSARATPALDALERHSPHARTRTRRICGAMGGAMRAADGPV